MSSRFTDMDGPDGPEEQWAWIRFRGQVASAIRGRRGQATLKQAAEAMERLPRRQLITGELCDGTGVCVVGAVIYDDFKSKGLSPKAAWNKLRGLSRKIGRDAYEIEEYAVKELGFTRALANEVQFENDEGAGFGLDPRASYSGMLGWLRRMTSDRVEHMGGDVR